METCLFQRIRIDDLREICKTIMRENTQTEE